MRPLSDAVLSRSRLDNSAPRAFMLMAASRHQTVQRFPPGVSLLHVAGAQVKASSGSAIGTITMRCADAQIVLSNCRRGAGDRDGGERRRCRRDRMTARCTLLPLHAATRSSGCEIGHGLGRGLCPPSRRPRAPPCVEHVSGSRSLGQAAMAAVVKDNEMMSSVSMEGRWLFLAHSYGSAGRRTRFTATERRGCKRE